MLIQIFLYLYKTDQTYKGATKTLINTWWVLQACGHSLLHRGSLLNKACPRGSRCCAYLSQRLQFCLHDELILAEFAASRVRTLDPLLQAGLVHKVKTSRTVAGGDQRALIISFTVTYPESEAKLLIRRRGSRKDVEEPCNICDHTWMFTEDLETYKSKECVPQRS